MSEGEKVSEQIERVALAILAQHRGHDDYFMDDCILMARAAIEAMPKPQGWQPIATAPKDGADVLLYYDGRAPAVAAWFRGGWAPMDLGGNHLLGEPTHWMPLHAPPSE